MSWQVPRFRSSSMMWAFALASLSTLPMPRQPKLPRDWSTRWTLPPVQKGFSFHRTGKGLREFLLQRALYKAFDGAGKPLLAMHVHAPRPLLQGKKARDLFAACHEDLQLLPEQKAQGICISQYSFDRACFAALSRLCLQRHEDFHQQRSSEANANLARLLDWVVCTPCCNHDLQNSLKWTLMAHVTSPSMYEDLYVGIESIRNSHEYLHKAIPLFLGKTLEIEDTPEDEQAVPGVLGGLGGGAVHARAAGAAQPQMERREAARVIRD